MKRTTNSHRIGGNRKRQYYRQHRPKIVRNRVFDCHKSPDWRPLAIENTGSSVCIKLFIVTLVPDCSGYVFSRPIFNKYFRYAAIENVYTIDKHKSKIVRLPFVARGPQRA